MDRVMDVYVLKRGKEAKMSPGGLVLFDTLREELFFSI